MGSCCCCASSPCDTEEKNGLLHDAKKPQVTSNHQAGVVLGSLQKDAGVKLSKSGDNAKQEVEEEEVLTAARLKQDASPEKHTGEETSKSTENGPAHSECSPAAAPSPRPNTGLPTSLTPATPDRGERDTAAENSPSGGLFAGAGAGALTEEPSAQIQNSDGIADRAQTGEEGEEECPETSSPLEAEVPLEHAVPQTVDGCSDRESGAVPCAAVDPCVADDPYAGEDAPAGAAPEDRPGAGQESCVAGHQEDKSAQSVSSEHVSLPSSPSPASPIGAVKEVESTNGDIVEHIEDSPGDRSQVRPQPYPVATEAEQNGVTEDATGLVEETVSKSPLDMSPESLVSCQEEKVEILSELVDLINLPALEDLGEDTEKQGALGGEKVAEEEKRRPEEEEEEEVVEEESWPEEKEVEDSGPPEVTDGKRVEETGQQEGEEEQGPSTSAEVEGEELLVREPGLCAVEIRGDSEEDLYRGEEEISSWPGKQTGQEVTLPGAEDRCSLDAPVDIQAYSDREWRGNTPKSALIRKGYTELSQRFGRLRRVRGDNYCALRATLFQVLSLSTQLPAWMQDGDISMLPQELQDQGGLIGQWMFPAECRRGEESEDPVHQLKRYMELLQTKWEAAVSCSGPEERRRLCERSFGGGEEELGLLEALKLLMLARAVELHAAMQDGADVPIFCWLLFARDSSACPRSFLSNHLSQVGFSGGLEQVEMFLLGHALQCTIQAYRLYMADTEEFVTYYPDDHKEDWPCVCLVTEDDRHYNVPVGESV